MRNVYTLALLLFGLLIQAQEVTITAPEFKSILTSTICADTNDDGILDNDVDTNNDGQIQVSETQSVYHLNTLGQFARNLGGINAFTHLKSLVCSGSGFQFLNISNLPELQSIECAATGLYSITLSGLPQLETLNCSNNELLSVLNFSGLDQLKNLNCSQGRITNLDLSPYPLLETLNCSNNQLSTIIISGSNNLQHLNCSANPFTAFDFALLPNLKTLNCRAISRTSIDVSAMASLESLNCAENHLTTIDISALTNLKNLECNSNNITTLDLSQAANLKTLFCSVNNLTALDLTNAVNLENLVCYRNNITSIDTSTLPNLKSIDCSRNTLTTLNVNTSTQLETVICYQNNLTALDVSNLAALKELNCEKNLLTTLSVINLAQLKTLNCATNNLPALNVSGLTALETLNCSFNNLTSLDVADLAQSKSLNCSNNHITSINTDSLSNLKTLKCSNNDLTSLIITSLPNLEEVECAYNHIAAMDFGNSAKLYWFELAGNLFTTLDFSQLQANNGKLFHYILSENPNLTHVNVKNGCNMRRINMHQPSVFSAYDCPNLLFVCADDFNVSRIYAPTAQINSYCSFNPGGTYNTITGTFILDYDNNGCDQNDDPAANSRININQNTTTSGTFTNAFGKYGFFTNAGTFTVSPVFENPYFIVTPQSAVLNFQEVGGTTQTQDFCLSPNGVHHDVEITVLSNTPRPGFDTYCTIVYKNKGNQFMSGSINFTYDDAVLDFVSTNTPLESQSFNNLNWTYSNLKPFESRSIYVTLNLNSPQETPPVNMGHVLNYAASITPASGDETPEDNTSTRSEIVRGSYDPNDKTCLEGDTMTPEMIGKYLHYLIRFQNKGTAAAENVVVTDVIDTDKFDMSSLQLTSSSHPQVTKITNNKVEFQFQNINLPAEIDDEPASHGYIAFKIKTKAGLAIGDSIENKANIYFDYNFPVETNTATTVVAPLLSADTFENMLVTIAPNPTQGNVHISSKYNITSVQLLDVQGRILDSLKTHQDQININLSQQSTGIYLLKIQTANGIKIEKIIKQ